MIPLSPDFPPEPQDCIFASTPYLLPPLSYKTHSFRLMQFYHTFCPFPVSIINEMKAFVCWLSLPLHEKETLPSAWRTSVFHQNPALQFPGLLVPSNLFTSNSDMHNQIVTIHNCCTSKNAHSGTLLSQHSCLSSHLTRSPSPHKQCFGLMKPPTHGYICHSSSNP